MSFIAENRAGSREDLARTGLWLQELLARAGRNPEARALGPALTHWWTPRGCLSTNQVHIHEETKDKNDVWGDNRKTDVRMARGNTSVERASTLTRTGRRRENVR